MNHPEAAVEYAKRVAKVARESADIIRRITIQMDTGLYGFTKELQLPDYGEVKIITHAGKITFIETTTKEKVE